MVSINKLRFILFLALILLAPLSKYPSIALPIYNFSSFRIGLYQLIGLLFVILCIIPVIKYIPKFWTQNKIAVICLTLLSLITVAGVFGSLYKSRSILLAISLLFLVFLVVCSWWYVANNLSLKLQKITLKYILIAGLVFGLLGLGQFIFSTFSNDSLGLLCKGCSGGILGFVRINLFAAEPQFFANAMLPFLFISLAASYIKISKLSGWALFTISLAIGLTFSRGAFIALLLGLIFYFVVLIYAKNFVYKKALQVILIVIAGIFLSFGLLFASANYKYRYTPDIARDTLNTMLGQLSAGLISLPAKQNIVTANNLQPALPQTVSSTFVSPGYIQASANERLSAADLALKAWKSNSKTVIFGVGSGNLGPYVIKNIDTSVPSNLTVYIFYILILAELGIIGLLSLVLLMLTSIYVATRYHLKTNKKISAIYLSIGAILVSFFVQYFFFGTYINAVYVWLYIGIALGIGSLPRK